MQISLEQVGKKFQHEWIFRKIDYQFNLGKAYAITGPNGSGKSTLLQVISGILPANEGNVNYIVNSKYIDITEIFPYIDIAAPYQELVEEFTLIEFLKFHFSFKSIKKGLSIEELIQILRLEKSINKIIKHFSSGMKQRLKLGLAFFSQSQVILLDEPTSNLDEVGINWYMQNVTGILKEKLIIICSNTPAEYSFCDFNINILDHK
ncbi:MAG: ATP-binding cassette domain-containing protein [Bacteroidota bacterium]|nr:ATP-binding cassette domain-containing protein [Bacteroidota bacterium]